MTNVAVRFRVPNDDRIALIAGDRITSYGELAELVGEVRGGFGDAGLIVGDRVMLIAGNNEVFVATHLACLSSGLVIVPVNPRSPVAELRAAVARCRPAAVVADIEGAASWRAVPDDVRIAVRHEFCAIDHRHPLAGSSWVPGVDVDDDHPAALLFTSGTAGTPRPAILTHRNLTASLDAMLSLGLPLIGDDDAAAASHTILAVVPLHHVMGLHLILDLGVTIGATIVLAEHRSGSTTAELIRTHQVTLVSGPPTLWRSFVDDAEVEPEQFRSVRFAVSGAAPLDPRLAVQVQDQLGIRIAEGYGLTETSGLAATALGVSPPADHGSVGPPFPGVEIRLVDSSGNDAFIGDPGEVWIRGPMVSPGYFDDAEATARTRTADGWLITGDLAVVDDGGMLSIVDRVKDLIIVSGFNVHPAEVERVLAVHELVDAVAVVGEADDVTGERPIAHVVLEPRVASAGPGETDRDDIEGMLLEHCRSHLVRYKVPSRIVFTDVIPTGLGGKLRRSELADSSQTAP